MAMSMSQKAQVADLLGEALSNHGCYGERVDVKSILWMLTPSQQAMLAKLATRAAKESAKRYPDDEE